MEIGKQAVWLDELDQRQDEVLRNLDELNLRIESLIGQLQPSSNGACQAESLN